MVDAETLTFEFVTPSIEAVSGYKPEELVGLTLRARTTAESLEAAQRNLREEKVLYDQGVRRRCSTELEMFRKDGASYWIEALTRFMQEPGQPLKIIGVSRDITELKRSQAQQGKLIQELGAALADKDRLLKENQILRRLLPICSGCRRIRDQEGRWWPIEAYVSKVQGAQWTHTICPDCKEVMYPDQSG